MDIAQCWRTGTAERILHARFQDERFGPAIEEVERCVSETQLE